MPQSHDRVFMHQSHNIAYIYWPLESGHRSWACPQCVQPPEFLHLTVSWGSAPGPLSPWCCECWPETALPSKYARSDSEAFWLWLVSAVMASVQPELAQILCAGYDFLHPTQFRFFQIKHWSYCTQLIWIWSGWPCQGLAKFIWYGSKPVCRNHWARFLVGYNRLATSCPLSDSVAIIHRHPRSYCAKPAWIRFSSSWLCQVLAEWIQSGSKPVYKNHPAHFCPMLPSRSGSDANQIWHIYWDCLRQVNTDTSQTLEGAVEC